MVRETNSGEGGKDSLTEKEASSEGTRATENIVSRRNFIKGVSLASLGAVGLSKASNPVSAVEESAMTETQVDVSNGEEVSGIIDNVSSGELLVFPAGTFTWSARALVTVDNWGIRCDPDTVFEVPTGWGDGDMGLILKTVSGGSVADNFLLENLTVDSPGRAAPHIRLGARTTARVDGLHYRMNGPLSNGQHGNGITAFVTDADGTLEIKDYRQFNNGDLGGYGGGDSRIGIFVGNRNDGTVHLINPVLQGFPNNGCYVSRQPGTVIVDGGLLMNNNVSAVRVSGGVEVRNTTIVIDIDEYLDGPGVIDATAHNTRGLWGDSRDAGTAGGTITGVSVINRSYRRCTGLVENGMDNPWMDVADSQFLLDADVTGANADSGEIEVLSCGFDGSSPGTAGIGNITGSGNHLNPDIDPGQVTVESNDGYAFDWSQTHAETPGRPTDSDSSTLDRTITFDGSDAGWTDYEVTVSGDIETNPDVGTFDPDDAIDGSTASGFVNGGVDGYVFSGEITAIAVDGDADVLVDGEVMDPDALDGADPVLTTDGPTELTSSSVRLNGTLEDLGSASEVAVGFDWRATGEDTWKNVSAGSYAQTGSFSATLSELAAGTQYEYRAVGTTAGGTTSTGSTASFATDDDSTTIDRTITFDGSDAGWTDYEVTVSGDIETNPDVGTFDPDDAIDGSTASGFVNGGVDGYVFSGEITAIAVDGDADVLVDGEEIDVSSSELPNSIVLDSRSYDGEASYELTVSGDLNADSAMTSGNTYSIAGSTVSGSVTDGRHGYRFSGDLVAFQMDGEADLSIEDNDS